MNSLETIFERAIPVLLEERQIVRLTFRIATAPKKLIDIQITDEQDPFFLFTLQISENDFVTLKREQGLLVDFHAFPSNLIELLESSASFHESSAPSSPFSPSHFHYQQQSFHPSHHQGLQKSSPGPFYSQQQVYGGFSHNVAQNPLLSPESPSSNGNQFQCHLTSNVLAIVEPSKMKHLTHLSLQMRPANDAALKKYLADKVKEFKSLSTTLQSKLEETHENLSSKLADIEKRLEEAMKAKENLELERANQAASLKLEYSTMLAQERDKSASLQRELQVQHDSSIHEREKRFETQLTQLKQQLEQVNNECTQLATTKLRLEGEVQSLSAKLELATMDSQRTRQEGLAEYNVKIIALKQQIADKEELVNKMSALLESSNAQKVTHSCHFQRLTRSYSLQTSLEDSLAAYKANSCQLEEQLNLTKQEVLKGNQTIQHLQIQYRNLKSKFKLKEDLSVKQEDTLREKQQLIEKQQQDITALKQQLNDKVTEVDRLQNTVNKQKQELEADRELLEKNEKVIDYLSKEINQYSTLPNSATASKLFFPSSTMMASSKYNSVPPSSSTFSSTPVSGTSLASAVSTPPILYKPNSGSKLLSNTSNKSAHTNSSSSMTPVSGSSSQSETPKSHNINSTSAAPTAPSRTSPPTSLRNSSTTTPSTPDISSTASTKTLSSFTTTPASSFSPSLYSPIAANTNYIQHDFYDNGNSPTASTPTLANNNAPAMPQLQEQSAYQFRPSFKSLNPTLHQRFATPTSQSNMSPVSLPDSHLLINPSSAASTRNTSAASKSSLATPSGVQPTIIHYNPVRTVKS